MPQSENEDKNTTLLFEEIYRNQPRHVFATLVRLLGDLDFAEEALHESFLAAIEQWSREGVPGNSRAWLVSTGRFKGIFRRLTRQIDCRLYC